MMNLPFATHPVYAYGVVFVIVFALASFLILSFIAAPYGRHAAEGWGPTVKAKYA